MFVYFVGENEQFSYVRIAVDAFELVDKCILCGMLNEYRNLIVQLENMMNFAYAFEHRLNSVATNIHHVKVALKHSILTVNWINRKNQLNK